MTRVRSARQLAAIVFLILAGRPLAAQQPPGPGTEDRTVTPYPLVFGRQTSVYEPGRNRSDNIKVAAHVNLGKMFTTTDIDVEQELSRPYAYVTRRFGANNGVDIIDLRDVPKGGKAKVGCSWRIENSELHQGAGALNPMYFKHRGRYYVTIAFQFTQAGPDYDLGAVVLDVTGLPNCATIKEVGRIREPGKPGGFHESFT